MQLQILLVLHDRVKRAFKWNSMLCAKPLGCKWLATLCEVNCAVLAVGWALTTLLCPTKEPNMLQSAHCLQMGWAVVLHSCRWDPLSPQVQTWILAAQEVRDKDGSFMSYVVGLPIGDFPVATIDKMNTALGLGDPALAGSALMTQNRMSVFHVGTTCLFHWSFAANSLWSGEAGIKHVLVSVFARFKVQGRWECHAPSMNMQNDIKHSLSHLPCAIRKVKPGKSRPLQNRLSPEDLGFCFAFDVFVCCAGSCLVLQDRHHW